MPRTVERRIGIIGGLAITLFVGVSVLALWNTHRLVNTSRWVAHTDDVIVELEALHDALDTAESSIRAYTLTGSPSDLAAYDEHGAAIVGHVARLRLLVGDNPSQERHLDYLQDALLRVLSAMGALRREHVAQGDRPAIGTIALDGERTAMRKAQDTLALMREEERRLQWERTASRRDQPADPHHQRHSRRVEDRCRPDDAQARGARCRLRGGHVDAKRGGNGARGAGADRDGSRGRSAVAVRRFRSHGAGDRQSALQRDQVRAGAIGGDGAHARG